MATTISVRLEKGLLRELEKLEREWQTDRSEAIRRLLVQALKEWKIQYTIERIKKHQTSVGKAAEECGISLWEMLALLEEVDWTGYTEEDLERDLAILK